MATRLGQIPLLAIFGVLIVFASVLGGFLLEQGNPFVLLQPAEVVIVGGAMLGILLVANPPSMLRRILQGVATLFYPPQYSRTSFLRHLRMLYEVFQFAIRIGIGNLETDVENPRQSAIFKRYPEFLKDAGTRDFLCDSLRMLVIGITSANELDHLMDIDIEVRRRSRRGPVSALHAIADSLPGLGIIAAVLGVVITMQAIGGAPETVGQKVAAALVGTFLGILLCYGVVGPAASRLDHVNEAHTELLQVLRIALVSFARGAAPMLAVEYARRSIPGELRPSFVEMEAIFKRDARVPPARVPGEAPHPLEMEAPVAEIDDSRESGG